MSVFKTLEEAVSEVTEHLVPFPKLGSFILKTKDENPYCPVYVVPFLYPHDAVASMIGVAEKMGHGEVVAVFATIR